MFPPTTHILIVDDSPLMHSTLKKQLTTLGFSVFFAAKSGVDALKVMEEKSVSGQPIELVLSDWHMPEMTGLEFLLKLRAIEKYSLVPFLMVTANTDAAGAAEAIKAGVSSYLIKPITPEQLKDKLGYVWSKNHKDL